MNNMGYSRCSFISHYSVSIIFRSMCQNYLHSLQRKVHIKAVNIFDTSAQKMFILRDLYLFMLKMYGLDRINSNGHNNNKLYWILYVINHVQN